jgi:hypothetical protein
MAAPRTGSTGVVEAKGDLLVFDGTDLERLAVGANTDILVADSTTPSGLAWRPSANIPGIGYTLPFGANFPNLASQGNYHRVSGTANTPNAAGLNSTTEIIVVKSGTLTRLGWSTDTATAATVYKVWKNGLVVATITLTGAVGVFTGGMTGVVIGDEIAIEYDAGPQPGNSQVIIFVE